MIGIQLRGCNYHTVQVQESGGRELSFLRPEQCNILRTNFVALRDNSYTTPHPCLLPLEENGRRLTGDEYVPVRCLYEPAPVAVLELINKNVGARHFAMVTAHARRTTSPALLSINATILIAATFLTAG